MWPSLTRTFSRSSGGRARVISRALAVSSTVAEMVSWLAMLMTRYRAWHGKRWCGWLGICGAEIICLGVDHETAAKGE
jgi:hypothetical protein